VGCVETIRLSAIASFKCQCLSQSGSHQSWGIKEASKQHKGVKICLSIYLSYLCPEIPQPVTLNEKAICGVADLGPCHLGEF